MEKISRFNPTYERGRRAAKGAQEEIAENHCFGAHVINLAQKHDDPLSIEGLAHYSKQEFLDLLKGLDGPRRQYAAFHYFSTTAAQESISQELAKELSAKDHDVLDSVAATSVYWDEPLKDFATNPELQRLIDLFDRNGISNRAWLHFLAFNYRVHREIQRSFNKSFLPGLAKDFENAFTAFAERHSLAIDPRLLSHTFKEVTFNMMDLLRLSAEDPEVAGMYLGDSGEIDLEMFMVHRALQEYAGSDRLDGPAVRELRRVFNHEVLHAISGRTLIATDPRIRVPGHINNVRSGARAKEKFWWLDEAITEKITQELSPTRGGGSYFEERELLQFLLTEGMKLIKPHIFYRAYFENYDPMIAGRGAQRARVGVPHWKAMWKEVEESFGPGFLNRLDKVVREGGAKYALKRAKLGAI